MVRAWLGEAHLAKARSLLDEAKTNEVKTLTVSIENFLSGPWIFLWRFPAATRVSGCYDHSDPKMS
jgi:hypothetical protein